MFDRISQSRTFWAGVLVAFGGLVVGGWLAGSNTLAPSFASSVGWIIGMAGALILINGLPEASVSSLIASP